MQNWNFPERSDAGRHRNNGGLPLRVQGRGGRVDAVGRHPEEARQPAGEAAAVQAAAVRSAARSGVAAQGQVLDRRQDPGGARGARGRSRPRRRPLPRRVQVRRALFRSSVVIWESRISRDLCGCLMMGLIEDPDFVRCVWVWS